MFAFDLHKEVVYNDSFRMIVILLIILLIDFLHVLGSVSMEFYKYCLLNLYCYHKFLDYSGFMCMLRIGGNSSL